MSNQAMSNKVMSNQAMSNQAMSNKVMSNQAMSNQAMSNQDMYSNKFDKSEIAITLICIGLFVFMIPTLYYLLGKPLEKVILRREVRDLFKRISSFKNETVRNILENIVTNQDIKMSPSNAIEKQKQVTPLFVFSIFGIFAIVMIIIGMSIELSRTVFKSVLLIVSIFIVIEVFVLITLGLLYRPLDILQIVHTK
jgi:hypothetical protein